MGKPQKTYEIKDEPNWRIFQQNAYEELMSLKQDIKPLTEGQKTYFKSIREKVITFCVGLAGTGKSYCSCGLAAKALKEKLFDRIVLTRPLINCGTGLGFLPGDVIDKVTPYMGPLLGALDDFYSPTELQRLIRDKSIEMCPLELMRGASFKKAFIVADESQNMSEAQLEMLLTRFGEGCKVVVEGDTTQVDIHFEGELPLKKMMRKLSHIPEIGTVYLTEKDIVRHPLIVAIYKAIHSDEHDESWFDFICPGCQERGWYNNGDETDVEKIICWGCRKAVSLFVGDTFCPRLTKDKAGAVSTFPVKP